MLISDEKIKEMKLTRNQKIRVEMEIKNHSQADLAKLLNLSRQTVNSRLAGRSEWKMEELIALARLYEKRDFYFF